MADDPSATDYTSDEGPSTHGRKRNLDSDSDDGDDRDLHHKRLRRHGATISDPHSEERSPPKVRSPVAESDAHDCDTSRRSLHSRYGASADGKAAGEKKGGVESAEDFYARVYRELVERKNCGELVKQRQLRPTGRYAEYASGWISHRDGDTVCAQESYRRQNTDTVGNNDGHRESCRQHLDQLRSESAPPHRESKQHKLDQGRLEQQRGSRLLEEFSAAAPSGGVGVVHFYRTDKVMSGTVPLISPNQSEPQLPAHLVSAAKLMLRRLNENLARGTVGS